MVEVPQINESQLYGKEFRRLNMLIVDHWTVQTLMTLVTLYALLGDDIRLIATTQATDNIFVALTSVSLVLFLIELLLASIGKDGYFNSFFFWLDLISTVSLVTDIPVIMNWLTGDTSAVAAKSADGDVETPGQKDDAAGAASLARASRGARIGTKAGRMTRAIRLIRLIRIVKLYKSANQAQQKREEAAKRNLSKTE